ncbi:MAG: hypothetical protein JSV36_10160 [Anaerolineae bacterium]|nr:MAG: hypothetical protein JSV36_10160 [Anaerolineae bacterium]
MFHWGYCEFIARQIYSDRLCEAEKSRRVRQARAGHRRRFHLRSAVNEAAKASKAGGGLVL